MECTRELKRSFAVCLLLLLVLQLAFCWPAKNAKMEVPVPSSAAELLPESKLEGSLTMIQKASTEPETELLKELMNSRQEAENYRAVSRRDGEALANARVALQKAEDGIMAMTDAYNELDARYNQLADEYNAACEELTKKKKPELQKFVMAEAECSKPISFEAGISAGVIYGNVITKVGVTKPINGIDTFTTYNDVKVTAGVGIVF